MSVSDIAGSTSPAVAEILAKLGTDPKTSLNSVQLQKRLSKLRAKRAAGRKKECGLRFARLFLGTHTVDDRGCGAHGLDCRRLG
jgi:hypothetical protein